ncbi:MAG TPA: hypothetical protein VFI88_05305 [Sphingomicrobium sp.]|jgi:hypothetical protein|nr:hypothetical protein [Sphingomicrobium sp.]
MSMVLTFFGAVIGVLILCPLANFVLQQWLHGRSLIIASVASATCAVVGHFSYSGPLDDKAIAALAGVLGAAAGGMLIGKLWLRRAQAGASQ